MNTYGVLGSRKSAQRVLKDLGHFVKSTPADDSRMRAFVALFPDAPPADEHAFEKRLWTQLQRMHDLETGKAEWTSEVSADPESPTFAFSVAGTAMFVVGMHAHSSRKARRFQCPSLVFNPRAQFERLRATGKFELLRERVREREIDLQGSLNPNLSDFGEASDARQYSGRAVEAEWKCPFQHKQP